MKAMEAELDDCKATLMQERIKYELYDNQLELCNREIRTLQLEGQELKHNVNILQTIKFLLK